MPHSHEVDPEKQEDQCTALTGFLRYAFGIVHRAGPSAPMKGIHRNALGIRYGRADRLVGTASMQNAPSGGKIPIFAAMQPLPMNYTQNSTMDNTACNPSGLTSNPNGIRYPKITTVVSAQKTNQFTQPSISISRLILAPCCPV